MNDLPFLSFHPTFLVFIASIKSDYLKYML